MKKNISAAQVLSTPWIFVDLTVLYLLGSLIGVPLEGCYTLLTQQHWETHVVSMFFPLCVIYGFGAALYYIASALVYKRCFIVRFLCLGAVGTFFELLCGLLLLYGLKMRAWDYSHAFMNYKGLICLSMFCVWGVFGLCFCLIFPRINVFLVKLHRRPWGMMSLIFGVIMILDLIIAGVCIVRWKKRVCDHAFPISDVQRVIDEKYPDTFMQERFIEWRFLPESGNESA